MSSEQPVKPGRGSAYLSKFMTALEGDRDKLEVIRSEYDNLSLLGQLLSAGSEITDIGAMRADFHELASELLGQLAIELEHKAMSSLRSNARVAIDILIRNLFERTADIGFLATDAEVRAYAQRHALGAAADESARHALRERFAEYLRKYSVYHDIILLAPDGTILVQLEGGCEGRRSQDPLIRDALGTSKAYCETFRATDLLPGEASPLIYSYRVMAEDGSRPVGVLCLCFRFADECQRIFQGLLGEDDWAAVTILDTGGRIIGSSDPYQFPPGARVERVLDNRCRVVRFAGREYLATTQPTQGYQGYMGPGWMGHALVPLNHAFEMAVGREIAAVETSLLRGVLEVSHLFSAALRAIPIRAETIQRNLDRAVWNGSAWLSRDDSVLNTAFAKVLLREIGNTGVRTRDVFSDSTTHLYKTVISAVLVDCAQQAALAMDIMDRNLYERANDCRWWALTGAFRDALATGDVDEARLETILREINGLYTVYSNLLIFDAEARVRAVSNPSASALKGRVLQAPWVRRALALADTQSYCVSDFEPSELYDGRPTYIYCAGIRHPADSTRVTGGVAIVFDSDPQFSAMLHDALPRNEDGTEVEAALAAFVERDGRLVASSDPALPPGSLLELETRFFRPPPGQSLSDVVVWRGRYYAVGSRLSSGYREYKAASDAYRNEVVALVLRPLSERLAQAAEAAERSLPRLRPGSSRRVEPGQGLDIATFLLGGTWFALPATCEVEAVESVVATALPSMPAWVRGCFTLRDEVIVLIDLGCFLPGGESAGSEDQLVVLQLPESQRRVAFAVDALGEVQEIDRARVKPLPAMVVGSDGFATDLVHPDPGGDDPRVMVMLSPQQMALRLGRAPEAAADRAPDAAALHIAASRPPRLGQAA